jgi:hypothetical protein
MYACKPMEAKLAVGSLLWLPSFFFLLNLSVFSMIRTIQALSPLSLHSQRWNQFSPWNPDLQPKKLSSSIPELSAVPFIANTRLNTTILSVQNTLFSDIRDE